VGVYQGEEAKIADLEGSLPAHLVEAVIGQAVDRGRLVAVMTEEWQTAGFTQLLSDELLWRGRDFGTVHEMKEAARRWCRGVSAARQHGTLPGTVGEVFASIERPALRELPEQPFEIARWAVGTLHPDCHLHVAGHFYSALWRHVGKWLHVRVGERVVRIYDGNELLKTHLLWRGRRRYTDPADYPEEKIAFLQRTPAWCRRRAEELGPAVLALVVELLSGPHPLACLRQAPDARFGVAR
jgi:hypothetical protein